MSNDPLYGLKAALSREQNKYGRQLDALSATQAMISIMESKIADLEKSDAKK